MVKMLILRKRGRSYHFDGQVGRTRLRGTLGTGSQEFGIRLLRKIEGALVEGTNSQLWSELKSLLPTGTYDRLAAVVGVKEKHQPDWRELQSLFAIEMNRRTAIGKLQASTVDRYGITIRAFDDFLQEEKITTLREITKAVIENFKAWRVSRIVIKKYARGATGLVLDVAILHRVFAFAVECELMERNPVRMEGRPGENPTNGAEPFTGADLLRLRDHAGEDMPAFLLLRWTGLRGSDAVQLTWGEVHFDRREIERITQKRKKRVIVPFHPELMFCLESEYQQRKPKPSDRVLLNPSTGKNLTRPRLYQRMVALGNRSGVPNAHPHRFRDTLAVDMLLRGAGPYDVAKLLGDTIDTVEKHYTPFVKELRERVRLLLENDLGLESSVTPASQTARRIQ